MDFLRYDWEGWDLSGLGVCPGRWCLGEIDGLVTCSWTECVASHSGTNYLLRLNDLLASATEDDTGCYREHDES